LEAYASQAFAILVVLIGKSSHLSASFATLARIDVDMLSMNGDSDVRALELKVTKPTREVRNSDGAAGWDDGIVNRDGVRLQRVIVSIERSICYVPFPVILSDIPAEPGLAPAFAKSFLVAKDRIEKFSVKTLLAKTANVDLAGLFRSEIRFDRGVITSYAPTVGAIESA
jgi:hypothetical protein